MTDKLELRVAVRGDEVGGLARADSRYGDAQPPLNDGSINKSARSISVS